MGKPSIFSKDYGKKMKRRRRNVVLLAVVCLLVITLGVIYIRGAFKDVVNEAKNKKVINNSAVNKQTENTTKKVSESDKKAETKNKDTKKENSYKMQLSDGREVTLTYEGDNSKETFKSVTVASGNLSYDISPSRRNVVLFDNAAQSILLVDIDGSKHDITNPQYVSTTGQVIQKSTQLASNPSYIWCSSPKFLDDGNIAYISQLPWLGKTSQYVWIENIQNNSHFMVQGIQGESIELGELTQQGLTVVQDGATVYVTASGSVSQ